FGVRTLFYRNDGNEFLLASEMEPLLEADGVHNELEDEAVLDYLLHDHRSRRETFFRGLLRVQPGHWLLARAGVVGECPYWRPPAEVVRLTDEQEYAGEFRRLFLASVEARLDRDCPTVAQLSGGLDSSSIVAAAQEICRRDPERP